MGGDLATDVVVVGAGNAGLCAALAAREAGAEVLVLERAPVAERGGNSAFTAGAMRLAYRGVDDLSVLMPDLTAEEKAKADFGSYTKEQFLDDIGRVTEYRCDPELSWVLVDDSFDALAWMQRKGVRFIPSFGRQAFEVDGRFKFWGGVPLHVSGGGMGLVDKLFAICESSGVEVAYETAATELLVEDTAVVGVRVKTPEGVRTVRARSVVLASGGFEANPEWRARYLGPGWDLAKVRGTRFNTGDGIRMALDIGAQAYGNWSGCHSVSWDRNAPEVGTLTVGDSFQKHSYPFGIMVNAKGKRFADEGADFRNYTYAKYGREVLAQPGQTAWQIFDAKVSYLLREEYRIRQVTRATAGSIRELADQLEGMDAEGLVATVEEFNRSVMVERPFNPNEKDGRGTTGVDPPKSNWANTIDEPPFEAYAVTCGITFTFGGLHITDDAEVIDGDGRLIPGLYACGELVGGLFYFNYPGGSGLTAGAVFGRRAGAGAGRSAVGARP